MKQKSIVHAPGHHEIDVVVDIFHGGTLRRPLLIGGPGIDTGRDLNTSL